MATQIASASSRRTILAAAVGTAGALVAHALGRPQAARAANGDAITVGGTFDGTTRTLLTNTTNFNTVLACSSTDGTAVYGESTNDRGVQGHSAGHYGVVGDSNGAERAGVFGSSASGVGTGVYGFAGPGGGPYPPAKTGVYGVATTDAGSRGVWGRSPAGHGVHGQTTDGSAVFGVSATEFGYAIRGDGRVRFDKVSGVATIGAGTTSKTITPPFGTSTGTFVLLTPQQNIGTRRLWVIVNPGSFTIHMSSSSASAIKVAWLLIN